MPNFRQYSLSLFLEDQDMYMTVGVSPSADGLGTSLVPLIPSALLSNSWIVCRVK